MDSYITRPIHVFVCVKIDTLNYFVDWIFYNFFLQLPLYFIVHNVQKNTLLKL